MAKQILNNLVTYGEQRTKINANFTELYDQKDITFLYKGTIALPSAFPDPSLVQPGWVYEITTEVTDNDATKTNTGLTFYAQKNIFWNGSTWLYTQGNLKSSHQKNITNWTEFFNSGFSIASEEEIKFNGLTYQNKTGTYTSTAPNLDTTNWKQSEPNALSLQFDTENIPTITSEGKVWWNGSEYTLNINSGLGATLQVGQETYVLFYNDLGSEIPNGKILHPVGGTVVDGVIVPTVELADASTFETCQGTLFVSTSTIPQGSLGLGTRFGKVRGLDTSALGAGSQVWLSSDNPGEFVNTQPEFPNYVISMGGTLNASPTDGQIFISITTGVEDTITNAWDGSIRESFDFFVTSNGSVITGALSNQEDPSMDLTLIFSSGFYLYDTTPPATITLTPGTDVSPLVNYVYIPKDTKTLTVSTTGWPTTEHAKVAYVALRSALSTQEDDALINQNWNDHVKYVNDNGHLLHIAEWIRQQPAQWNSGVLGTATVTGTPSEVYVSVTEGEVYQLHKQTFPSQNTQTGDEVHVVNDPTEPLKELSNLANQLVDASGNSLLNKSFSFVLWGIQNKNGEESHLMLNLPSSTYARNDPDSAVNDALNYTVYDIPNIYKSVGFLIARFTFQVGPSGDSWILYDTQDLRGSQPSNVAGGSSGGASTFVDLVDTPNTFANQAGKLLVVNDGETALEFQAFSAPNLTTTERNALTPSNGWIIYNTTTNQFEFYENGAWVTK